MCKFCDEATARQARRNIIQDQGFDLGREAAHDALIGLERALWGYRNVPRVGDEEAVFNRAVRQGFMTTIRRCLPPFEDEEEEVECLGCTISPTHCEGEPWDE